MTSVVLELECPANRAISSTGAPEADSRLTKLVRSSRGAQPSRCPAVLQTPLELPPDVGRSSGCPRGCEDQAVILPELPGGQLLLSCRMRCSRSASIASGAARGSDGTWRSWCRRRAVRTATRRCSRRPGPRDPSAAPGPPRCGCQSSGTRPRRRRAWRLRRPSGPRRPARRSAPGSACPDCPSGCRPVRRRCAGRDGWPRRGGWPGSARCARRHRPAGVIARRRTRTRRTSCAVSFRSSMPPRTAVTGLRSRG